MSLYLATMLFIFVVLLGGIGVDRLYRHFAARNRHLGPFRSENPNCGDCSGGSGCAAPAATCGSSQTTPITLHRH